LTITCRDNAELYIQKIKNQGLITINPDCRSTQDIQSKYYVHFIPKIGSGNIIFAILNEIKYVNLPRLVIKKDSHNLDKVHRIAHSLDYIQNEIDTEIIKQTGQETVNNTRITIYYI